jgi:hypothetical protein
MWKADLNTKVRVIAERLAFLDDLEAKLAFPPCVREPRGFELKPLWDYYNDYMDTWHNGPYPAGCPPHPVNQAWALVGYEDVDGEIAELMELDRQFASRAIEGEVSGSADGGKDWIAESMRDRVRHRCRLVDVAAVMSFNRTLNDLSIGVRQGEEECVLLLAQVDKSIILADPVRDMLLRKQYEGDWKFFAELGKALQKRPLSVQPFLFRACTVVAYFWDEHFREMPYPEIVACLERNDVLRAGVAENLRKMLNARGLKKPRFNRKPGRA